MTEKIEDPNKFEKLLKSEIKIQSNEKKEELKEKKVQTVSTNIYKKEEELK